MLKVGTWNVNLLGFFEKSFFFFEGLCNRLEHSYFSNALYFTYEVSQRTWQSIKECDSKLKIHILFSERMNWLEGYGLGDIVT